MLVCDTSCLIAFFDSSDAHHRDVSAVIENDPGPFVVSPYVLAELDYILATRRGVAEELAALDELSGGAWDLVACDATDVRHAREIIDRYADQNIGLADASLVLLAGRYRTNRLLTLDHRHFRVLRTVTDKAFAIFP